MSQDYPYTNVVNVPDCPSIHVAVAASAMTDKAIEGVSWKEATTTLTVTMVNTLSGGDETILDSIVAACPDYTYTKPIYYERFDADGTTVDGNHRLLIIAATANDNIEFIIPEDFEELVSMELVGYAVDGTAFGASKDIDFVSEYGGDGDVRNIISESDTSSAYTAGSELKEWFKWDISGVFSSIVACSRCSLNIEHKTDVGGNIGYSRIEFAYHKL